MISASCPSCGSPITFQSGAALTAVCGACQSCVVREGELLRDYGKVARFQRDLSPLQLDAHGRFEQRSFRVVGVLRKARHRVRWNEWYVLFDDGQDGWIGEGNGQWFLYTARQVAPEAPALRGGAGADVTLGERHWKVMEDDEVAVVAAEGGLPFALSPGAPRRYLDLREVDGAAVATLDFADDPPTLWIGRDVTLLQLQMEGLRPFAGWSDPVLVHFAGPELSAVRALQCPACGAGIELHAPGQVPRAACAACGSLLGVTADGDEAIAELLSPSKKPPFVPTIPLGTRGRLEGIDWEVIGAMVRAVRDDGGEWPWVEYLLHNPYRGFCWLVHDTQKHWSHVEMLRGPPPVDAGPHRRWRRRTFRRFGAGRAQVKHVLGEFTWEVAVGDQAVTEDYVDPPEMLSYESQDNEVTWAVGTWKSTGDIAEAFGVSLPSAQGVAPHQPNPAHTPAARRWMALRTVVLVGSALLVCALAVMLPDREQALRRSFEVVSGENVWVTEPFRVGGSGAETLQVRLDPHLPTLPDLQLSLIHQESGAAWDWTTYGNRSAYASLQAGTYTARLALPANASPTDVGKTIDLTVTRDPGMTWPALVYLLLALATPLAWYADSLSFETRRWSNA